MTRKKKTELVIDDGLDGKLKRAASRLRLSASTPEHFAYAALMVTAAREIQRLHRRNVSLLLAYVELKDKAEPRP